MDESRRVKGKLMEWKLRVNRAKVRAEAEGASGTMIINEEEEYEDRLRGKKRRKKKKIGLKIEKEGLGQWLRGGGGHR